LVTDIFPSKLLDLSWEKENKIVSEKKQASINLITVDFGAGN
jgi:hypothetical protein